MIGQLHNNIGIIALAISNVLAISNRLSVSKSLLIAPIITNTEMLNYLARKSTNINSVEQLIVKKTRCVANFNSRYYDNLVVSMNAIQLLNELDLIEFSNGTINHENTLLYDKKMGKRAEKIVKSSDNISKILHSPEKVLYVNFRVQI